MNDRQNNHSGQSPNQWNNQWSNGPSQPQQPGQAQPPQYQRAQPQPPQYQHQQPFQQQPPQQPGQQWQQQPAAPPATETKKKSPLLKIGALLAALVLAIAGGIYVVTQTGIGQKLAEMSYIASADPGPEAFMEPVTMDDSAAIVQAANFPSPSLTGGVEGGSDNLYGGTGDLTTCDAAALIEHLYENDDLNAAFAEGLGINADDVSRYVRALSPLVLMQDTWVTNHGFKDGRANPFQAVLQRGTAVLVDANGVPRVRCACGNPLAEAWNGYTAPGAENASWDDYSAGNVVAVYSSDSALREMKIRDLEQDASDELTLSLHSIDTQNMVYGEVTSDTPKTVPSDMDVKPDKELLEGLGMSVADSGDERPTGGERFATTNGTFAADGAAEEPVEPAVASDFRTGSDEYAFRYSVNGNEGGCTFETEEYWMYSCTTSDLPDDIFNGQDHAYNEPFNLLFSYHQFSEFLITNSAAGEGPPSMSDTSIEELKPGQTLEIDSSTSCELSKTEITCTSPGGSFRSVFGEGVYLNGSSTMIGQECGDGVRTLGGGISCEEALKVKDQYWDDYKSTDEIFRYKGNEWMCSDNSQYGAFIKGSRGNCGGTRGHHESFFLT